MRTVKNEKTIFIDVDDTLVKWSNRDLTNLITINDRSGPISLSPNEFTIAELKRHKKEGKAIIVWSQGGYKWATKVVKALQLVEYVDMIISKPCLFYDDLPASCFMAEYMRIDPTKEGRTNAEGDVDF